MAVLKIYIYEKGLKKNCTPTDAIKYSWPVLDDDGKPKLDENNDPILNTAFCLPKRVDPRHITMKNATRKEAEERAKAVHAVAERIHKKAFEWEVE